MKLFNADNNLMTEGNIRKKIIFFAIPVFIGQLFQQLYNTADALIVGNFVEHDALAAVSATGTLIFLLIGFFFGFSMGAGVVVAREIGAGDETRISKAVHTTVAMGICFSVLITVLGVLFSPLMLSLIAIPDDVFSLANTYLRIYFLGAGGLIMYNTFVGILQASGDSKHPLVYLIISSLTNVVLDVVFIGVFHMGVAGAAIATGISQFLSMGLALHRLLKTKQSIRISLRNIRFDKNVLKEILKFGFPTALQGSIIDLSNILIQSYINSFGSLAMAGIGAYSKIEGFAFLPVISFSMAMSTFISQNMGAGKLHRVKRGMRFGILSCVAVIECIGIAVFIFAPQLIALFNAQPEVVRIGVMRARICSLFFCLLGFSNVTNSVLRGLGKPLAPMLVMLICWCAVRVAVFMSIGKWYHVIELTAWIYPITWGMSTLVYAILLLQLNAKGLKPPEKTVKTSGR